MPKAAVILPQTFKSQAAADAATKRMADKLGVTVGAVVKPPHGKKRKTKAAPKRRKAAPRKSVGAKRRRNPSRPHKAYVIRSERIGVSLGGKVYTTKEKARVAARAAAKRTGHGVKIRKVQVLKGKIVG